MSDEAHFHLGGNVNKQNCRIWGSENPNMIIEQPFYPQRALRKQFCQINKNILLVFMQQNYFVVPTKHFVISIKFMLLKQNVLLGQQNVLSGQKKKFRCRNVFLSV